jgi:hypothetical protein
MDLDHFWWAGELDSALCEDRHQALTQRLELLARPWPRRLKNSFVGWSGCSEFPGLLVVVFLVIGEDRVERVGAEVAVEPSLWEL